MGPIASAWVLLGIVELADLNPDGPNTDAAPNPPADPSLNVRQLFVAEPFMGAGANQLNFKLQLGQNGTVLPNSEWYIIWQRIHPDADFDRFYVAMRSDATGAISFEYGKFGVPLDTSGGIPNPNSNTPQKLGNVDSGTYDPETGVCVIKLSTSKAENIAPGQSLNGLNVRNFVGLPPAGPRNQAAASDMTGDGSYRLVGNGSCLLNQPPVAAFTAKPESGGAPLQVQFDASASNDPDAGDSVAKYRFTFGDGTPEKEQAGPKISHIYKSAGTYVATLKWSIRKDWRARTSRASMSRSRRDCRTSRPAPASTGVTMLPSPASSSTATNLRR